MTVNRFRILIILHVLLLVAGMATSFIPDMYSPALELAYANEPDPWIITNVWSAVVVLVSLLLITVIGLIGLYRLKPWGRSLSLWTTILVIPLSLTFGPTVEGAIVSAIFETSTTLWGAILALAYYSPIASMFGAVPAHEL